MTEQDGDIAATVLLVVFFILEVGLVIGFLIGWAI